MMKIYLTIAAFAIAFAVTCLFYMQIGRSSPKQVVIGSIAGSIVGLLALSFALVR